MSTKYNTQSDKDKVHKFIYIYIDITNISHITQSDKDKKFYKTKTIKPKTWSIGHKKESLMTY